MKHGTQLRRGLIGSAASALLSGRWLRSCAGLKNLEGSIFRWRDFNHTGPRSVKMAEHPFPIFECSAVRSGVSIDTED